MSKFFLLRYHAELSLNFSSDCFLSVCRISLLQFFFSFVRVIFPFLPVVFGLVSSGTNERVSNRVL